MPIIVDSFKQQSPEWMSARSGNPGASSGDKIITTTGLRSKQREDYMRQLCGEFITGKCEDGFQSQSMLAGNEREQYARQLFEMMYEPVRQVGIIYKDERKDRHCSPDGLVGERAGLEIKAPMMKTHIKYLLENVLPTDYFVQVQFSLYVSERELWYFMSYYEGLPPFIVEVKRDEGFIRRLESELNQFSDELMAMVAKIDPERLTRMPQIERSLPDKGVPTPEPRNGMAPPKQEELCPNECPDRPGDFMTKAYCMKCKSKLFCKAWAYPNKEE